MEINLPLALELNSLMILRDSSQRSLSDVEHPYSGLSIILCLPVISPSAIPADRELPRHKQSH